MAAQVMSAGEFLEQAVTSTPLHQSNQDIQNALASLRQIVHLQKKKVVSHESIFSHQNAVPKGGKGQLPMPPLEAVLKLLREIQGES